MKISNVNFNLTFTAKHKKAREADDISRISKRIFPLYSSTYIKTFLPEIYYSDNPAAKHYISNLINKIEQTRNNFYYSDTPFPYGQILKGLKRDKVGNCHEMAITGLAALAANGYTNSSMADLVLSTNFINKETNQVFKTYDNIIDHVLVITTMDKNISLYEAKGKDLIIVDNWSGICETAPKAVEIYKSIFREECKEWENNAKKRLKTALGENVNFDDYIIRTNILFLPCDKKYENSDVPSIQKSYRELIRKPQNNQSIDEQDNQDIF